MHCKIVSDSSSNIYALDAVDYASVPLHVLIGDQDFTDDRNADPEAMQQALDAYKGKTSTSCPNAGEWLDAFGSADVVFCVTITSKLSGANSSAMMAKQMYEQEHPGRRVHVFDSLSTGPEMALLIDRLRTLILDGLNPEHIYQQAREYLQKTRLFFSLASLDNMAKNGRVNPLLAKGISFLGIRVIGRASEDGVLQPLGKARGDKTAVASLVAHMKEQGYAKGRVIIAHNRCKATAEALKERILKDFGAFNGIIHSTGVLCSYYAEPQSVLVGFETE